MSMMCLLSRCALSQVIGESAEGVMKALTSRFSDRSRELIDVLHQSSEKAWKAVEISLAGESLWNKLDAADEKSFRQQVRNLLDNMQLPVLTRRDDFRKLCLQELQLARRDGHLLSKPTPEELHRSLGGFASHRDQEAALAHQRAAIEEMAALLERQQFKNLAWLVGHEVQPGQGLLVVAVQYFFRRAIDSSDELRDALQFSRLETLGETQAAGFLQLEALLQTRSQQMDRLLGGVLGVVVQTRDAVLDIHQEQQKHGGQLEDIYQMLAQLLEQTRMQHRREVRPGDTRSIRGPGERARVLELVDRYEALPESEKQQRPALLHSVALLQVAAGETQAAQQNFEQLASLVAGDPRAEGQARYNAYQAALTRHDFSAALDALREAATLDPEHYAPFPFSDYIPERILGAGGFGVAIKCQHATLKRPLVVKTLWLDGLDRAVDDVFREARVLNDLDHPAIIHLRDCRFADAARKRPYLVMDYFESLSLTEQVRQHGPLTPADLLPIARTVAEALQSAHVQGILHRDIKPDNLLVRREPGGSWRVKLIDFGLAVKQETIEATVRTPEPPSPTPHEFTIAGTIDYAAPEQMGRLPGVPVGPYSDVYGFAKTCYFALLGTPEPDDNERATLDEGWRKLLSQCTARKIENRVKDFAAVLARLHEIEHPSAHETPHVEPAPAIPLVEVEKPKLVPPPPRKGSVPPRYIEPPVTAPSPVTQKPSLSPLWTGGEKIANDEPAPSRKSSISKQPGVGALFEPDLTGAVPVEEEPQPVEEESTPPDSADKAKRRPLGGAFGL